MMENSIYSILSPEGFATILWKDSTKAKEAAEVMKLTASAQVLFIFQFPTIIGFLMIYFLL